MYSINLLPNYLSNHISLYSNQQSIINIYDNENIRLQYNLLIVENIYMLLLSSLFKIIKLEYKNITNKDLRYKNITNKDLRYIPNIEELFFNRNRNITDKG